MPSLKQLRYFATVAQELNFRRAAERLNMSQPPLTQQIKAMELELGVELFRRSGRRITLTEGGELILYEALATLAQADRIAATATLVSRGEVGRLRLGFTASAPLLSWFSRTISAFNRLYPSVTIEWSQTTSKEALSALERRNLDLALVRMAPSSQVEPPLEAKILGEDRLMLVLSSEHPLAQGGKVRLEDVTGERFFCYRTEHGTAVLNQVSDLWSFSGSRPKLLQETDGPTTMLALVAARLGVAVLPSSLGAIHLSGVAWREIDAPAHLVRSTIRAVYQLDADGTPATRRFLDLLLSEACAVPAKPGP